MSSDLKNIKNQNLLTEMTSVVSLLYDTAFGITIEFLVFLYLETVNFGNVFGHVGHHTRLVTNLASDFADLPDVVSAGFVIVLLRVFLLVFLLVFSIVSSLIVDIPFFKFFCIWLFYVFWIRLL